MLGSLLFITSLTMAEPEPKLSFGWDAPAGCVDPDRAIARLHELLPELPALVDLETIAELRADVEIIDAHDEGFRATLRFDGPRGYEKRSFTDPRCEVVAEAALLVIVVSLDPVGTVDGLALLDSEPEPELELDPEPDSEPDPELRASVEPLEMSESSSQRVLVLERGADGAVLRPATREQPKGRRRPVRAGLGVLGGGGYGPLDLAQVSFGAEVSAFGPWWRTTLRGLWLPPRTVLASDRTARYDGFDLGVRGCGVPWSSRRQIELEFPLCLAVEGGVVRGEGTGPTPAPQEAVRAHLALATGPGLRWVVRERLALLLEVDLVVALMRGGFTIGGTITAELAPVGLRGLVGVELRLP